MKKLVLFLVLFNLAGRVIAQSLTLQQKLYYTCKVWGFVKYYHSNVGTCHVNWDSVLLHTLPLVRSAATSNDFNDALDSMLAAAGPMALSTTYFPDTLPAELKRNRDWSWTSEPVFRADVQAQLDTIKHNFRPFANCWVMNNTYTTSYAGYLEFPYDSLSLDVNTTSSFPDSDHRQLMLFKYWNIIRYFNPYNYILDTPIDTTLYKFGVAIDTASTAQSLYLLWLNIATTLNDAHVQGATFNTVLPLPPGYYFPLIRLKYTGGQYVVAKSMEPGIIPGDIIVSVNGLTPAQWEDSLRQYYSAGNLAAFRRTVSLHLLGMNSGGNTSLVIKDGTGTDHTFTPFCVWPSTYPTFFNTPLYFSDIVENSSWTTLSCDIGYVNMGNLLPSDVNAMYSELKSKSAIIFDMRYYPNGTIYSITNLMYGMNQEFAKLTIPDVTYAGTFSWEHTYSGVNGNPNAYTGKVILLCDEWTQSQGEYTTMALSKLPNVIKVGSQTAGADGNITYWRLSQDLSTGFTNLGVYYPNGDSTQRIGITPDSVVYPTSGGIRGGLDEVLEKGLQIAGCGLSAGNASLGNNVISAFPNPAEDNINIEGNVKQAVTISMTDIMGRVIAQKVTVPNNGHFSISFNIERLPQGLYFINAANTNGRHTIKFLKK